MCVQFNQAVKDICANIFPNGFDVADDAPNTYEDLFRYVCETGRMCVTSSFADDPTFNDAQARYAFRAWHDWTHLAGGYPFTLEGECAAARAQFMQLAMLYGEAQAKVWEPILRHELIVLNFDECTTCPKVLGTFKG